MIAVIDTNILVSALWTPDGNTSLFISKVISGAIRPCYDFRMLSESAGSVGCDSGGLH